VNSDTALSIELRNPSDTVHEFRFLAGDLIGLILPLDALQGPRGTEVRREVRCAEDTTFTVPPEMSRYVAFSEDGHRITMETTDDINCSFATSIDASAEGCSRVPLPGDWSQTDLLESKRIFNEAARSAVVGITDDPGRGLGGHSLIATSSRLRSERTGQSAIYSPSALGLEYAAGPDSLFSLVLNGDLVLMSAYGEGYNQPDSIRLEVHNPTSTSVTLKMPSGTVFEQLDPNSSVQNLILKIEVVVTIAPNDSMTLSGHGMCANQTGDAPGGERILITPFRLTDSDSLMSRPGREQDDLWERTGRTGRM